MGTYCRLGCFGRVSTPARSRWPLQALDGWVWPDYAGPPDQPALRADSSSALFLAPGIDPGRDIYFMDEPFAGGRRRTDARPIVSSSFELQKRRQDHASSYHHDLATVPQYFYWGPCC